MSYSTTQPNVMPALPPSHEVLADAMEDRGRKAVASAIGLSAAAVHKFCESSAPGESGSLNPLDRVLSICRVTESVEPARWLCVSLGGFYVQNPRIPARDAADVALCDEVTTLAGEFGELMVEVRDAGKEVDRTESLRIRSRIEDLKMALERFGVACEAGHFSGRA